jgi:hypothetical protein
VWSKRRVLTDFVNGYGFRILFQLYIQCEDLPGPLAVPTGIDRCAGFPFARVHIYRAFRMVKPVYAIAIRGVAVKLNGPGEQGAGPVVILIKLIHNVGRRFGWKVLQETLKVDRVVFSYGNCTRTFRHSTPLLRA